MTRILHFTIGPVQSFVDQARRTRDLWAGSFLLSWLSGQAMYEIIRQGGKISFPVVKDNGEYTDPLLKAVHESATNTPLAATPSIGSLPNRFRAVSEESLDMDRVRRVVQERWEGLAQAVWDAFIPAGLLGGALTTRDIWDGQVKNFWEIAWVEGTGERGGTEDGNWLDLRKNWRSHWPVVQGGDHCTLMGDFQELSGEFRSHPEGRKRQDAFWRKLRDDRRLGPLELREGERLCAIALIKRLFPKLDERILKHRVGWVPGGSAQKVGNWPSTSYMAAVPWLQRVNDSDGGPERLEEYAESIRGEVGIDGFRALTSERATRTERLENLDNKLVGIGNTLTPVTALDGSLFHEEALMNARSTPFEKNLNVGNESAVDSDRKKRNNIRGWLRRVNKGIGGAKAQPFYALLVMDGDKLGDKLEDSRFDNGKISRGLSKFTHSVAGVIERFQGITVYAGGDDVLALLPITRALPCTVELRRFYGILFDGLFSDPSSFTASASIVFSHFHLPLKSVLREGHRQLETIAKERNGRNSLALAVYKSEGITAEWVGSFNGGPAAFSRLQHEIGRGGYSTGFFYKIGSRYPMLKSGGLPGLDISISAVLRAEYTRNTTIKTEADEKRVASAVSSLVEACRCRVNGRADSEQPDGLQMGGAYIARFIDELGDNLSAGRSRYEAD